VSRWRAFRGQPVAEPAPVAEPVVRAVEHRAAAAEAAVWLLRNTDVPTDRIVHAYLDELRAEELTADRAARIVEVVTP
jgi:hypothetical protein